MKTVRKEPGVVLPPVDCIWKVPLVVEGFFEPGEGATVQCQVTNLKLTAQAPLKNGDPPTWFWRNSYWQPPFLGANCLFQGGYVLFFWGGGILSRVL